MNTNSLIERGNEALWHDFLSFMPENWMKTAQDFGVMKGAKRDKDIVNSLRTLFVHLGAGASLKETVAYAKAAHLCDISSVALYHRLVKFGPFFHELCRQIVQQNRINGSLQDERLLVVDASDIKEPGPTGSHFRLHYCIALNDFICNHMELTSTGGAGTGETLARYPVLPGDHFIADRGYSFVRGIGHIARHGGKVLVRLNHRALPLYDMDGSVFPLLRHLKNLVSAGDFSSWHCKILDKEHNEFISGRICAVRKSPEAIQRSLATAKEDARRKGKKITNSTLELCEYTVLFTTFEEKKYSAAKIMDIYRWRWQIELVFKRFKSLLAVGCLPKKSDESSRAWLYGKLLLALLIERICYQKRAFSPWRELPETPDEIQRQLMAAF